MGYIAKCAVEIQNIESAKMMWKYLDKYSKPKHCTNRRYLFDVGALQIQELDCPCDILSYIYCLAYTPNKTEEEAVKLFLELAQMKGDSKYVGQWRKKGKEYFKLTKENIDSYWCINSEVVSPIRLAIAFKNKEVEL